MSFTGSGKMAVCIAIFPNSALEWTATSPFPGESLTGSEEYFVLSDSVEVGAASTKSHPIYRRLVSVGKSSNEVNFLAKTYINKNGESDSDGIGGLSKLKFFDFGLSVSDYVSNVGEPVNKLTTNRIHLLYGHKIALYLTNTGKIEDLDHASVTPIFIGQVYGVSGRDQRSVTFVVKGILDTNDPTVKGETITNSEGQIVTDTLVFGDSGETYLKLNKVEDGGSLALSFTQSANYILKDLYVKQTNDANEDFFYPLINEYNLQGNNIQIVQDQLTTAVWKNSQKAASSLSAYDRDRIVAENAGIFAIQLRDEKAGGETITLPADIPLVVGRDYYWREVTTAPNVCTFLGLEEIDGVNGIESFHLFKAGYEFIEGHIAAKMVAKEFVSSTNFLVDSTEPTIIYQNVIGTHVVQSAPPIYKDLDATKSKLNFDIYSFEEFFNYFEDNGRDQGRDGKSRKGRITEALRIFQGIPKEPVVIKVDDEEMLVTYTEMETYKPTFETVGVPLQNFIYVRRGINDTVIADHADGTPIYVKGAFSQKVKYSADIKLKGLKTMSATNKWNFNNLNSWLKGEGDLSVVASSPNSIIDPVPYLGLNWDIPNLTGELLSVAIQGDYAEVNLQPRLPAGGTGYLTPLSGGNATQSFIGIALNAVGQDSDDWDITSIYKIPMTRRVIGRRTNGQILGTLSFGNHCLALSQLAGDPASYRNVDVKGPFVLDLLNDIGGMVREEYTEPDECRSFFMRYSGLNNYKGTTPVKPTQISEFIEDPMYLFFVDDQRIARNASFKVSPITLDVQMETDLKDIEVYAKVVPKTSLGTITDSITVGSNCKIIKDNSSPFKGFESIIVSDDDLLGYRFYPLGSSGLFKEVLSIPNVGSPILTANPGILTSNLPHQVDEDESTVNFTYSKMMTSTLQTYSLEPFDEDDIDLVSPTVYVEESRTIASDIFYEEGKTFIEAGNFYVWVDQDNNQVHASQKSSSTNNPVEVIRTLLLNYGGANVEIDTVTFDQASLARSLWKCKVVIDQETQLKSIIDKLAKEHGLLVYENELAQMACIPLDPPVEAAILSGSRDISDSIIIAKRGTAQFREQFTDLRYLITELDVYYDKDGDEYKGYIQSDQISYQGALDVAKDFIFDNNIKINLKLDTIIDKVTADQSAVLKSYFHYTPTRIITVKTIFDSSEWSIGQWVSCSSPTISDSSGKIYLITKKAVVPKFKDREIYVELIVYEWDSDDLQRQIHEVPVEYTNTNYDEVITDVDQLTEVPNATS